MAFKDFTISRNNKIVIGGASGVGIILVAAAAVFNTWVRPALLVENPDGERLIEISDHGAIGTGTGANPFGSAGDCLKSGGGSGKMMSFGTCGSGGGTGGTYTAGQGLTDTNSSFKVNASLSGVLLRFATQSGYTLFAKNTLTTSGSVKALGNISGATLNVNNLKSCANVQTDASGRATCNPSTYLTADLTTAGQGLTQTVNSIKLNATITGSLVNFQTVSGSVIKAKDSLNSSGSIVAEGTISGANLYAATSIQGAGLASCSNGTTSKLLWNSTSGRFSCGTDTDAQLLFQTLAVSGQSDVVADTTTDTLTLAAGSNMTITTNAGTDTVTLASTDTNTTYTAGKGLTLTSTAFSTNASLTGTSLRFQTISGSTLKADLSITSSGSIMAEGTISGANLYSATSFKGSGLVDCSTASTSKLLWTAASGRFSCGTDTDTDTNTTYTAGQGLTLTSTSFKTNATLSGTSLIKWQTISGSYLHADTAFTASGYLTVKGLSRFTNIMTTVATSNNNTNSAFWTTQDGRVTARMTSSGSLTASGTIMARTSFSGSQLKINGASLNYITGNVRIGNTGTPKATLDVVGTISGSSLNVSNNITASGSLSVEGANYIQHDVIIPLCDAATACATGSGASFIVRGTLSGATITNAYLDAAYTGTTGTMTVQLRNITRGVDVFSTKISLDSAEPSSDTAATPAVIGNATLRFGDIIVPFIAAVHTTPAKGVSVTLHTKPQ